MYDIHKDEYTVLEAIYPEFICSASDGSITLEIAVDFGAPRNVVIVGPNSSESTSISMLPPLLLHIALPYTYPFIDPPQILSIRSTHTWMLNVAALAEALYTRFTPGEEVLYIWVEFIHSSEFLACLNLVDEDVIKLTHPAPRLLVPFLQSYERSTQTRQFVQSSYECSVCMESNKGSKCLRLSCEHVFCRACLYGFWHLLIAEGDIQRVGCPHEECMQKRRNATEEEVAKVVRPEELVRWRWLLKKALLEKDPNLVHCPLNFCQAPIPKPGLDPGGSEDSPWSRLRECPSCLYSFCVLCRRAWHGPVNFCPISSYEQVVKDYIALPEDSAGRRRLDAQFGRATLLRLIRTYEENKLNREWLKLSTTTCPGCNVNVEKSFGCNHITCKCGFHFCFVCGARLDPQQPYKHYNTKGTGCYYKLFEDRPNLVEDLEWEPTDIGEL